MPILLSYICHTLLFEDRRRREQAETLKRFQQWLATTLNLPWSGVVQNSGASRGGKAMLDHSTLDYGIEGNPRGLFFKACNLQIFILPK